MIEGKFTKDLTGQVFGRLVVLEFAGVTKHRLSKWKCSCSCGNETTVIGGNLKSGTTTSCGCLSEESRNLRSITHGMSGTPEFSCWQDMLKRCKRQYGKEVKNYTERGIEVHEDFQQDFMKFYNEIGAKPDDGQIWSVGRKNNNVGYTYGNIQWELPHQQARNKTRYATNTTGVAGVYYIEQEQKFSVYRAYVANYTDLQGKQHRKHFNIKKLGEVEALQMAAKWRKEMIDMLNILGAGYAESHGSEKYGSRESLRAL